MFKTITVINNKNESLTIDFYSSESSGFNIREITGLGPVKANISTTNMATSDGSIYNSARADQRNIVLTLGFKITPSIGLMTIEDVRQKCYKYFPLKKLVKLSIETDNRGLYTFGYVESNEPQIWSDDETAQISLICPSSYFTSEIERDTVLSAVEAHFRFPFRVDEEETDPINIMIGGKPESIQVVSEEGTTKYFDGNYIYGLYEWVSLYYDISQLTYNNLTEYTYLKMKTASKK